MEEWQCLLSTKNSTRYTSHKETIDFLENGSVMVSFVFNNEDVATIDNIRFATIKNNGISVTSFDIEKGSGNRIEKDTEIIHRESDNLHSTLEIFVEKKKLKKLCFIANSKEFVSVCEKSNHIK